MAPKTKKKTKSKDPDREIYLSQNRMIHMARSQIGMSLDDCRAFASDLFGTSSISSLSPKQRWKLIEALIAKGADVHNPPLSKGKVRAEELYPKRLEHWQNKFPRHRPGFASVEQLAWIEALWEAYFEDGRAGKNGLRGFIVRQTRGFKDGPISDLRFVKVHHIKSIMTPLKARQWKKRDSK
jgi:hypothetical protein